MSRKKEASATGVLVINKPHGVTSHDVVASLRKLYNMPQVGHTGTLDPMATGVLPILLGRAVKASDYLVSEEKEYAAVLTLGVETDTEDSTGNVLATSDKIPSEEKVLETCRAFTGEIEQIPPMYSAVKIGGEKLYEIARRGETVERTPRRITILSLDAKRISEREYSLHIVCSKGTYIRTLCADIGRALGAGGIMSSLCRTRTGSFTLAAAHTLDEIESLPFEKRLALPMPTESLFESLPELPVNDFNAKLAKNGAELYQSKLGTDFAEGELVRIKCRGTFFALGRVGTFRDGSAVKPVKLFVL